MLKESKNKYAHLFIDLYENRIFFHSTSEHHQIGECILDFVYADLSKFQNNIMDLPHLHPYFECFTSEELSSLNETEVIENLKSLQTLFKQALPIGIDTQKDSKLSIPVNLQKFPLFTRSTFMEFPFEESASLLLDVYIMSFEDCLMCEFMEIIRRRIYIKICKNCNRMFLPTKKSMDYCNRIFTTDGKTCADVGYVNTYTKNLQTDELLQVYIRAYKAHYARMMKPRKKTQNMTREAFEAWHLQAKTFLEQTRQGLMDADEFKSWLKK